MVVECRDIGEINGEIVGVVVNAAHKVDVVVELSAEGALYKVLITAVGVISHTEIYRRAVNAHFERLGGVNVHFGGALVADNVLNELIEVGLRLH